MAWTERQRMMLEEIGIRLWMPPPVPLPAAARRGADRVAAPVRAAIAPRARQPDASASAGRATIPSAPAAEPLALDPARAIDVDALDADALAARAAACTACALCTGRSHSVFASGKLVCGGKPAGCAQEYEKCTQTSECCGNAMGFECINGFCALKGPSG